MDIADEFDTICVGAIRSGAVSRALFGSIPETIGELAEETIMMVRGFEDSPMAIPEAFVENFQGASDPSSPANTTNTAGWSYAAVFHSSTPSIGSEITDRSFCEQSECAVTGEEWFDSTSSTGTKCDRTGVEIICDVDDRGDDIPSIRYLLLSIRKRFEGVYGYRF